MPANPPTIDYQDPESFSVSAQGLDLTFYPAGVDRLDALIDVIEQTQKSLKMFYYMFQEDGAGTKVRDALVDAAKRGVDIHLLVDRFGTDAPEDFFVPIAEHGGRFAFFSPRWNVRYLIRNHQKFLISDEQIVMTGGFNVSDHYFAVPADNGWSDLGVKIEGAISAEFLKWFEQLADWVENPKAQFRSIRKLIKEWDPGNGPVRLALGGPTRAPSNWARMMKRDLAKASRLDLAMAYFTPPLSFRRLIRKIPKRGKVRLIMAGKSDNGATVGASRSLYGAFLRRGAQIFEFQPCKLHMKLIVVDDAVYFGSSNFDHRSIRLNLELMVRIDDAALAARVREMLDAMEAASKHVTYDVHRRRSTLWTQLKWRAGWFLVTTLDYTVTRRLNAGN